MWLASSELSAGMHVMCVVMSSRTALDLVVITDIDMPTTRAQKPGRIPKQKSRLGCDILSTPAEVGGMGIQDEHYPALEKFRQTDHLKVLNSTIASLQLSQPWLVAAWRWLSFLHRHT